MFGCLSIALASSDIPLLGAAWLLKYAAEEASRQCGGVFSRHKFGRRPHWYHSRGACVAPQRDHGAGYSASAEEQRLEEVEYLAACEEDSNRRIADLHRVVR